MKAEELKQVLDSLTLIQPLSDRIAKSFYEHLFEIAPHTRRLFTGDMERQGAMLMTSLSLAVNGLSNMEEAQPAIQALGERHYSYGVKLEFYEPAVDSFLWALEHHLEEAFTPSLKESWHSAFKALTDEMKKVYDLQ